MARVSAVICRFVHNCLVGVTERECTQTTDVSENACSGGATTDARSSVASADVCDATQDARSGIHEDLKQRMVKKDACIDVASTDARSCGANTDASDSIGTRRAGSSTNACGIRIDGAVDDANICTITQIIDVSEDACIGGVTTDARSGVASADARDVNQDARSGIHEEADSDGASTDARIGGANTSIMSTSPSTCDSAVQTLPAPTLCEDSSQTRQLESAPLSGNHIGDANTDACGHSPVYIPMQSSTEDSSQTRQLERAPPTGGKPCATIVQMSLSTRDNAIQTTDVETPAGRADATTQSASSADNTTTPANGATTEMQTQLGARQGELANRQAAEPAELMYRLRALEEQLSVARVREDVEFDSYAEFRVRSGAKDDELSRSIAAAVQLGTDRDVLGKELSLARARSSAHASTPAQRIAQQAQQQQEQQQQREKTQQQRLLEERQQYHLAQIRTTTFSPYPALGTLPWAMEQGLVSTGKEAAAFAQTKWPSTKRYWSRVPEEQLSELRARQDEAPPSEQQAPISQAPISTSLTPHTSPDGGRGNSISLVHEARKLDAIAKINETGNSISLAQEARKLDVIGKINETRKRNQKKDTQHETKIATHASTLSSALAKGKKDETSEKSLETPDRKSQPSKCGKCKEAFMSRNALFKHLDE